MTTKIAMRTELTFRAPVSRSAALDVSPVASNQSAQTARSLPLFIPADQAFYWSRYWQEGAQESMQALSAGEYTDFNSNDPDDVVHWLFSVDENDC